MKKKSTRRLNARQIFVCLTLFCSFLSLMSQAQISLVRWENFFFGPPVPATSALPMNTGKELTAGGQGSAFVSSGQFIANNWSVGNYFQAHFSTTNYSSNTITFFLEAYQFGVKNLKMQYAVGSATNFQDFGTALTFPAGGGSGTYTYNLPAACNNQANVYIRITATSTSNGGGNAWDDVIVTGSAMTAPNITSQPASTTTCEGADATFTVVANNAISYQWEYRTSSSGTFTAVPNNATYDNETTASLTVNNVTTAMSGYQYRCVVTGGTTPNAISNTATITVNAYGTWNGSVNSNWNNAANWNCSTVPTATTNVTINSGGNQPVINIGTAICNNLTINAGATLSFAAGTNQLEIKGATSVAGTLNGAGGKVVFSGTSSQTLPAGNYKDLEVNSSSNKTLGGSTTVTGILSLNSGTITLNANNLTIASTGSISGATANSFIVTNGVGQLIQQSLGAGARTGSIIFPIGTSATSFTPLVISNTNGVADNFTVQVKDGVFTNYTGNNGSGAITANSVNKTWFVSEAVAGGSNATIQLTWNQANELAGFDRENCQVSHFTGSFWQPGPYAFASGANPYTVSRSGITSFSPFGVGSLGSPLPVELISFTGKREPNGNVLNWLTANEKGFASFDIERSSNGVKFEAIGNVAAQSVGEGAKYAFTDEAKNLSGTAFYRLRMNDEDGAMKYSSVVQINSKAVQGVSIYPNPVLNGTMYIQLAEALKRSTVTITDLSGRVLQQDIFENKGNVLTVAVDALPAGNYILVGQDANGGTVVNAKFVIP